MDLINEKNLSKELIFNILERVYMSPNYDDDGDIRIEENHNVFIIVKEKISTIKLMSVFKENSAVERPELIEQANEISMDYPIKATITKNNGICFLQEIFVSGGVTEKNFILAIRRFTSLMTIIGSDDEYNLLGK